MELPTKENPTIWNDSQDKIWVEDEIIYWVRTLNSLDYQQAQEDIVLVEKIVDEFKKRDLPALLVIDIGTLKKVSREAREEYRKFRMFTKVSVVNDSPIVRLMVSFTNGLNSLGIPIKAFKTNEQAIEWLKS